LVGSANQALLLEKAGADGVIAEGKESGGHIGDVTTIVLVNAVLKAVKSIPVIAAGGIVDGDSYRAMRAMGQLVFKWEHVLWLRRKPNQPCVQRCGPQSQ